MLALLAKKLTDCQRDLRAAVDELQKVQASQLGSDDLDEACEQFREEWSYGMSKIKDSCAQLANGLATTAKKYQSTEGSVAREVRRAAAPEGRHDG